MRLCIAASFFFHAACSQRETRLVWSDEFDNSGVPDTTKWSYDLGDGCPQVCGWGNNERQHYTRDPKNVRVSRGKLIIEAHREASGERPYTSARIVSRGKGDWRYGRIEVRARLPRGRGTWPAIWMLPTDWKYGGWPASGEIDIMEHVGFDPGVVHGTIHCEKYNHLKQTQQEGTVRVPDCQDNFHTYAVTWRPDQIDFLVDGQKYFGVTRNPADDFRGWPFDQRFHLVMNLAVGGNWGGREGIDETIWPQRMEIDYVRVYK